MQIQLILVLIGLGLASGYLAGLLGIGGGMVLVPLLTLIFTSFGFPGEHIVHMAIATSLATIFFTSMSSAYAHNKKKAVLWPVAFLLIPGVLIGSWIGPTIAAHLNSQYLAGFFGAFVIVSALRMLRKPKPRLNTKDQLPNKLGMSSAGFGIGCLSGLVGAGGGFITVPFLIWRGTAIHNAVATSAVMGFPIALAGSLSNIYNGWNLHDLPSGSLGYIYLPALVFVAGASIFSAPLGAKTAHNMPVQRLRSIFAYMLLILALYMIWKAID